MGTILVVDGPEKSGKSTLIGAVVKLWPGPTVVRRWGPVQSDHAYLSPLQSDVAGPDDLLTVWDRSWASEHAYAKLLRRDRRLGPDPWLGEWLYGRAVQSCGMRVMVLPHDTDELLARRDDTDLPVDVVAETAAFVSYAVSFGWAVVSNDYTAAGDRSRAESIVNHLTNDLRPDVLPPTYAGLPSSRVIMVGERRNDTSRDKDAWLPFTTRYTTMAGRALGQAALEVGWANAHDCPPQFAAKAEALVAYGQRADEWCRAHVGHTNVLKTVHPSALYRWGQFAPRARQEEARVIGFLREVLGTIDPGEKVQAVLDGLAPVH